MGAPLSPSARIAWMDILRGYAMMLVVLGHGLMGLISAKIPGLEGWGRNGVILIYLFHVGEILNQPASLLRKTMCCLFFYGLGRLASEKRNLLDAMMARLECRRFSGIIAGACGVAALALVAFLYSNKPDEKLQLLSEPQGWILVTGTLGIAIGLIVARRTESSMMGCWIKRIGMYSMVIYVQHTIWGAAIRSLLMRVGVTHPAPLIIAIVAGGILLPVLCQKILDSRRLTRFFGIRAVTSP